MAFIRVSCCLCEYILYYAPRTKRYQFMYPLPPQILPNTSSSNSSNGFYLAIASTLLSVAVFCVAKLLSITPANITHIVQAPLCPCTRRLQVMRCKSWQNLFSEYLCAKGKCTAVVILCNISSSRQWCTDAKIALFSRKHLNIVRVS